MRYKTDTRPKYFLNTPHAINWAQLMKMYRLGGISLDGKYEDNFMKWKKRVLESNKVLVGEKPTSYKFER